MSKDTYQSLTVLHFAETLKKNHTRKRLQCLLIGNFGAYNLGGEAALTGLLAELAHIPNCKVTVVAQSPAEVKRIHNIRAVSFGALQREIKKYDFIIINSDGILTTSNPNFLSPAQQLYLLSILLWKQRLFKKKIYIFGLGLTESTHFLVKQLGYQIISSAAMVTARDQQTADILKQRNIHVATYKDITYLMDPAPVTKVMQDLYFKRLFKKNKKNIALSFRKPASKRDEKHLMNELVAFIAKNYETSAFWFYPLDHNPRYFNDEKFGHLLHEMVKKKVGNDVQFHFIPASWSPELFFASIKLMDFTISMYRNISLFAYRHNVNLLCVAENKRDIGFVSLLGREILYVKDLTAKKLQGRM